MSEPASAAEYEARYHTHQRVSGFGLAETRVHVPCPFCAAKDWIVHSLLETEAKLAAGATCAECGRSARLGMNKTASMFRAVLVQTGGPEPAPWVSWIGRDSIPPPKDSDPADGCLEG